MAEVYHMIMLMVWKKAFVVAYGSAWKVIGQKILINTWLNEEAHK